jgi:hypothetical protein
MAHILAESAGLIAPYYNLAFVIIVVILFIKLFQIKTKKVYNKPWMLLFAAICIFIVEEIMTVLSALNLISFPQYVFGLFEMAMVTLFIYMLLLQKQFVKTGKRE